MVSDSGLTLSALATGAVFKYCALWWLRNRKFARFQQTGTISTIVFYPVKSCRGIYLNSANCEPVGICHNDVYDRSYVFVDHTGLYVTQRQKPKMALIQPRVDDDWLVLEAPGMEPLKVGKQITPDDNNVAYCKLKMFVIKSVDCGQEAADWICRYLDTPGMRLLNLPRQLNPRDLMKHDKPWSHKSLPGDVTHYSDFCSYMIASASSLTELNDKLERPVKMERFRPNFIVSGAPPFVEEKWEEFQISSASFRALDMCTRCVLVTVDPDRGAKDQDGEPLKTLEKYYSSSAYDNKSLFGVNSTCDDSGTVTVGDTLYTLSGTQ